MSFVGILRTIERCPLPHLDLAGRIEQTKSAMCSAIRYAVLQSHVVDADEGVADGELASDPSCGVATVLGLVIDALTGEADGRWARVTEAGPRRERTSTPEVAWVTALRA